MVRSTAQVPDYVSLVVPPYVALIPFGRTPVPLGTIVVADSRAGSVALDGLIRVYDAAPWCAVCLVHHSSAEGGALLHVAQRLWPSVVGIATDALAIKADAVRNAVSRRGSPSFAEIATHVSQRLNAPALLTLLLESFDAGRVRGAAAGRKSRRTLDRHMRPFGPMAIRDWRALARIVQALASHPSPSSIERLAWSVGVDPRTLRGYCHAFLGLSPRKALELVGWQWILEATLRAQGYLATPIDHSLSNIASG